MEFLFFFSQTDEAQLKKPKFQAPREDIPAVPKACESCSKSLKKFQRFKDTVKDFSSLVKVFSCQHSPDNEENKQLVRDAMDNIVNSFTIGMNHPKGSSYAYDTTKFGCGFVFAFVFVCLLLLIVVFKIRVH